MYNYPELVKITNTMFEKAGVECVPFNNMQKFDKTEIQEKCNKMLHLVKEFNSNSGKTE